MFGIELMESVKRREFALNGKYGVEIKSKKEFNDVSRLHKKLQWKPDWKRYTAMFNGSVYHQSQVLYDVHTMSFTTWFEYIRPYLEFIDGIDNSTKRKDTPILITCRNEYEERSLRDYYKMDKKATDFQFSADGFNMFCTAAGYMVSKGTEKMLDKRYKILTYATWLSGKFPVVARKGVEYTYKSDDLDHNVHIIPERDALCMNGSLVAKVCLEYAGKYIVLRELPYEMSSESFYMKSIGTIGHDAIAKIKQENNAEVEIQLKLQENQKQLKAEQDFLASTSLAEEATIVQDISIEPPEILGHCNGHILYEREIPEITPFGVELRDTSKYTVKITQDTVTSSDSCTLNAESERDIMLKNQKYLDNLVGRAQEIELEAVHEVPVVNKKVMDDSSSMMWNDKDRFDTKDFGIRGLHDGPMYKVQHNGKLPIVDPDEIIIKRVKID